MGSRIWNVASRGKGDVAGPQLAQQRFSIRGSQFCTQGSAGAVGFTKSKTRSPCVSKRRRETSRGASPRASGAKKQSFCSGASEDSTGHVARRGREVSAARTLRQVHGTDIDKQKIRGTKPPLRRPPGDRHPHLGRSAGRLSFKRPRAWSWCLAAVTSR